MLGLEVVTVIVTSLLRIASSLPLKQQQQQRHNTANSCDSTIWDNAWEDKGVRNVYARCSEGRVEWHSPYGAVRVNMLPSLDNNQQQPFQACFLASVQAVPVKISVESSDFLEPLVLLNHTRTEMDRELCFKSRGEALTVYVEAESSLDASVLGVVVIDYDLEILPGGSGDDGYGDSDDYMEECRPCTNEELLLAVCSSDFVVQGSIRDVIDDHQLQETQLHLQADRVIRQRREIFTPSEDQDLSTTAHRQLTSGSSLTFNANSAQGMMIQPASARSVGKQQDTWTGFVIAPHKCHIRKGSGQFLFVGKVRLKRAVLKCAPRLEDFQEVWETGARTGDNPCVLE